MKFVTLVVAFVCVGLVAADTTLERAFERAFNEVVEDGTWRQVFSFNDATVDSSVANSDLCAGSASNWPWPERQDDGTDLEYVLTRGEFVCGYNPGADFRSANDNSLHNTQNNEVTGAVREIFDAMANRISAHYNVPFVITWDLSEDVSDNILDALQEGRVDAACGRWGVGGVFRDPDSTSVYPRAQAFSLMQCTTYLSSIPLWSNPAGVPESFEDAVADIEAGASVCSPSSATGGTVQQCTAVLGGFVSRSFSCTGLLQEAWTELAASAGDCDYVWGSYPPDSANIANPRFVLVPNYIEQAGSFFRKYNINSAATVAPAVALIAGALALLF
eukprot:CAMPEP_0119130394 /NCGR_PEP_ID=MMETSP1310-20130426/7748_1 /TAXON_ID=464262 /ORGANISM="Genus nov. species nov., Strain RCC2339" /LENGTH=331 /DNA_ID=CAMNT_0007120899 /DNA_START=49 /DNA_END=1044 /DNA_ORIENTATION=+